MNPDPHTLDARQEAPAEAPFRIGFLLFPHLTQLDLTGPAQVFANLRGAELHFVWRTLEPVPSDAVLRLVPTHTFESTPQLDLLCVPGGPGQRRIMRDPEVLGWLARQATGAQWITSVCSGSLLLGAAGLLRGYRAACHWNYREHLPMFGAVADPARIVVDRNRITGGGVTAGIDFALQVVAMLRGDDEAREIQLLLEYAPQPPFDAGRPELAGPVATAKVSARLADAVRRLDGEAT